MISTDRWKQRVFYIFMVGIIVCAVAVVNVSYFIKWIAIDLIEEQGLSAEIDGVDIHLFAGEIVISQVEIKNNTEQSFKLDKLGLQWEWAGLLDKKIMIKAISIEGLHTDVYQLDNDPLMVAGFKIDDSQSDGTIDREEKTSNPSWQLALDKVDVSDLKVCYQHEIKDDAKQGFSYCGHLDQLQWEGLVDIGKTYHVAGDLFIGDIAIDDQLLEKNLFSLAQFKAKQLRFEKEDRLTVGQLSLNKAAIFENKNAEQKYDVMWDALDVSGMQLQPLNQLVIDDINVSELSTNIIKNADGGFELATWFPQTEPVDSDASKSPEQGATFFYEIKQFNVKTDQHIRFVDHALTPTFSADLHHMQLKMTSIDNQHVDVPARLVFKSAYDDHGGIDLAGDVYPFAEKLNIAVAGNLSAIDLRPMSAFSQEGVGYRIKSGQMDMGVDIKIKQDQLDSKLDMVLHQFYMQASNKTEAERFDKELGFPINSSLSLLRDKDNKIKLELPITGDVNDPNFDIKDVITTVSSKAISAAVINYYTPYGLWLAATAIFDLATALKFDPLVFAAGQSDLNADHIKALNKMAALMVDRPGVTTTLCGWSNTEDQRELFPDQIDDAEKLNAPDKLMTEQLLALAEARSLKVKNFLVGDKKLDVNRIIICAPSYEASDKLPRVEISI